MTTEPPADLIARWRKQAAEWTRMAADARQCHRDDLSNARDGRAEVYEYCASALEAWQAEQPATPPREINCTAAVTQIRPNPDLDRRTSKPFGFTQPEATAQYALEAQADSAAADLLRRLRAT